MSTISIQKMINIQSLGFWVTKVPLNSTEVYTVRYFHDGELPDSTGTEFTFSPRYDSSINCVSFKKYSSYPDYSTLSEEELFQKSLVFDAKGCYPLSFEDMIQFQKTLLEGINSGEPHFEFEWMFGEFR